MCGRTACTLPPNQVLHFSGAGEWRSHGRRYRPRVNLGPMTYQPVITARHGEGSHVKRERVKREVKQEVETQDRAEDNSTAEGSAAPTSPVTSPLLQGLARQVAQAEEARSAPPETRRSSRLNRSGEKEAKPRVKKEKTSDEHEDYHHNNDGRGDDGDDDDDISGAGEGGGGAGAAGGGGSASGGGATSSAGDSSPSAARSQSLSPRSPPSSRRRSTYDPSKYFTVEDGEVERPPDAPVHRVERRIEVMRWGLMPSFAADSSHEHQPINARSDNLSSNMWRRLVGKRRCVAMAEGYYEWKESGGRTKKPYYIKRKDGEIMFIAGLYDIWTKGSHDQHMEVGPDGLFSYALITTDASMDIGHIHHRMPVILKTQSDVDTWLDPEATPEEFMKLLQPPEKGFLTSYEVPTLVSNIRNDSEECRMPVKEHKMTKGIGRFFAPKKPKAEEESPISASSSGTSESASSSGDAACAVGSKRPISAVNDDSEEEALRKPKREKLTE